MRADLIERLRAHAGSFIDGWEDWANRADTLMREAADALASLSSPQEPVAWRWRPLGATVWIYDPTPEWLKANRASIECEPLFASPVVPVAAKAEAEGWNDMSTVPTEPGTRIVALMEAELEMEEHKPALLMGGWSRRTSARLVGWRPAPTCEGEGTL